MHGVTHGPLPCFPRDVTPAEQYKQRMKSECVAALGTRPEPALQLSHFVFRVVRPHGHALALSAPALYARSLPDVGCQDGSRVFRTSPSKHAAAHTPGKPNVRSGTRTLCIAFAVA